MALLYCGGDFLVTGSVRFARYLKVSSFVIGATVIAFGTSSPELAASILAALDDAPELAMGNIIGSNIANIGLVLGLTCLIAPIAITPSRLKREYPPFDSQLDNIYHNGIEAWKSNILIIKTKYPKSE